MVHWLAGRKSTAWLTLGAGAVFIALSLWQGLSVFGQLQSGGFTDPQASSTKVQNTLAANFTKQQVSAIMLLSDPKLPVTGLAFQSRLNNRIALLEQHIGVVAVQSYLNNPPAAFVSRDGHATYATIAFTQSAAPLSLVTQLSRQQESIHDGLTVKFGGLYMLNNEVSTQIQHDIERAELISFPLLLILLLIVFRGVVAALIPLTLGGLSILGAFLVIRGLTHYTDISVFAINIITLLGLGLAIDYSLLIVSRFREELATEQDVPEALTRTMATAGRAVFFSGLTVAICLLTLLVFPITFLRSMGLGGASAVVVAVVASLTILPATLRLLGPRINAWSLSRKPDAKQRNAWYRWGLTVMRRPWLLGGITLALILLVGLPFLHIQFSNITVDSLPTQFQSRQVNDTILQTFNVTQPPEVTVVVNEHGTDPRQPANERLLAGYAARLQKLPGVTRVTGLILGQPLEVSGSLVVLNVDYTGAEQSLVAQHLVQRVRQTPPPASFSVETGGVAAQLVDQLHSLSSSLPLALVLVALTTLIIFLIMLGSVVIPIKAIILNILSLSAAFGVLIWVFQENHLAGLLQFTSTGAVDATIPILIFAIAFGLATDYEVFLLSRIKEAYDRTNDNQASIAEGLEKTGGIITSAAMLLVVVIGSFATSEISLIKQVGIGLAVAVLVDATIVRLVLVPAAMRIMGRINWWRPSWLAGNRHAG